jgi:hypothetical protein
MTVGAAKVRVDVYRNAGWRELTGYYGGSFNATPNAASRMELTFPNKMGKNLNIVHIGEIIRLHVGLDGLPVNPRFYGFVANRNLLQSSGQASVSFECFDFLGLAQREQIKLEELGQSVEGMDTGTAIKWILETMAGGYIGSTYGLSTDGIVGVKDQRKVLVSDGLYTPEYGTKLGVIQELNEMSFIDQYPAPPRPYVILQDGAGVFHHRPVSDITNGTPRLTVQYAGNMAKLDQKTRTAKLLNNCKVIGAPDPNSLTNEKFVGQFHDLSFTVVQGGVWDGKFNKAWCASVDACRDYAMRKVALYRDYYEPVVLALRRGYYLMVGDLINLENVEQASRDENMRVLEVDVMFQPMDFSVRLTLGAMNYLPTDYI